MSFCDAPYRQTVHAECHSSSGVASAHGDWRFHDSDSAGGSCHGDIEQHRPAASCIGATYTHKHAACGSPAPVVNVVAIALQDAAHLGAGVQGAVGCSDAGEGAAAGNDADGSMIFVDSANGAAFSLGDGNFDTLILGTGDGNHLAAGNGDGDFVFVGTGDHNCLIAGDGDFDWVGVSTGSSNDLKSGNGNNDTVSVDTGDNNMLKAGNGDGDFVTVGTGDHNALLAGDGNGDFLLVRTGDGNLLYAGNGNGDMLEVMSGNDNALIVGNGNGDTVTLDAGNNNILACGNGDGDVLQFFSGDNNLLLQGHGLNDRINVGVGNSNAIVMGNGDGDQAWGSAGSGNVYITGAGNDLVHMGVGSSNDVVYVDNHTEQSAAAMADPFHLTTQDSLAQNLFADGGNNLFIVDGPEPCGCTHSGAACNSGYSTATSWQSALKHMGGDAPGLGTTVMTGGGGAEKYWFDDLWGNAVITDYVAGRDKIMIGEVDGSDISDLGPLKFQYVHSAYDTSHAGAVDLLITFGSSANLSQSITLIDFKETNAGLANLFNNLTVNNPNASATLLSKIFDFSAADNQAVTAEIASLNAQHLILH